MRWVGWRRVCVNTPLRASIRIIRDQRSGGGDHVARVLLVPGRVGDDVLACAGSEIAVGHVDGNALFAFGLQAVGEQRKGPWLPCRVFRRAFDGMQRVCQNGLGVVQQAADQRALAVVDATAGEEASRPLS